MTNLGEPLDQQPIDEPQICNDSGIQVFSSPNDLSPNLEYGFPRIINSIIVPSLGSVEIYMSNNPDDQTETTNNYPVYFLDGENPYSSVSDVQSCLKKGLFGASITLEDAEKYLGNEMQVSVWVKGRSRKFTAAFEDTTPSVEDPIVTKTTHYWKIAGGEPKLGLYLPNDFNVLKDLQLEIRGTAPQGGEVN